MATLHMVNKSPARSDSLRECLRLSQPTDAVLLLEDGVLAAVSAAPAWTELAQAPLMAVYATRDDVVARGLQQRVDAAVQLIDYERFVALCTEYDKVVSWY